MKIESFYRHGTGRKGSHENLWKSKPNGGVTCTSRKLLNSSGQKRGGQGQENPVHPAERTAGLTFLLRAHPCTHKAHYMRHVIGLMRYSVIAAYNQAWHKRVYAGRRTSV